MKCIACCREAKYMVHDHCEPHCEIHFQEAVEDCMVMTKVMTVESWKQRYWNQMQALKLEKEAAAR